MAHDQALKDYQSLQRIAGGDPHDSGEILESIAVNLLKRPSKRAATDHLVELIHAYFTVGDASGNDITGSEEACEIFRRHGLIEQHDD